MRRHGSSITFSLLIHRKLQATGIFSASDTQTCLGHVYPKEGGLFNLRGSNGDTSIGHKCASSRSPQPRAATFAPVQTTDTPLSLSFSLSLALFPSPLCSLGHAYVLLVQHAVMTTKIASNHPSYYCTAKGFLYLTESRLQPRIRD